MPLKGVLGVWHRFKKEFWCRLLALFFTSVKASWAPFCTFLASKSGKKGSSRFALYQCDFSGCWTPFWGSCSPNLAKRGPAACSFGVPWFSFSFSSRWSPFWGSCSPNLAKRGPAACSLEFHDLAFHFLAAEPLFVLPAFWILQKGVQQHLISDFYLFPCAGPLFQPWAAEILQKGAPQLDIYVAPISASTCYFFGAGKVHCFFARGSRCATTMQGLELDLRFCDGKLDCFFCWTASPYLPLDSFPAMTGRDPPKRGPPPHQFRALPFSRCWTPFPAVSGRDPPKRGVATWRETSFHLDRLCQCQLSLFRPSLLVNFAFSLWQILSRKPYWERALQSTVFSPGPSSSVGRADGA